MSRYSSLFTGKNQDQDDESQDQSKPFRFLFVDDEANVLSALRRVFRQENYEIDLASDGLQAVALLEKHTYHLIITDYQMPKMNGADLLRKAKSLYPDMVRIMLTGHADTQAVMAAINEGSVYKFILKPWDDDDLRVTVALALEQFALKEENKKLQETNLQHKQALSKLTKLAAKNRSHLTLMLNKKGLLSDLQVQKILKETMLDDAPPIKRILNHKWVPEEKIRKILKNDFFIEEVLLDEFQIHPAVASLVPASMCRKQLVLPIKQEGKRITLVMADPLDEGMLENLKFSSGIDFIPVMANVVDIERKIRDIFGEADNLQDMATIVATADPLDTIEVVIDEDDSIELEELLRGTNEPPAIRLTNAIILEAIRLNVSDIHIQPTAKYVLIRYRIDGVLYDKIQVPSSIHMSLVSRIKVMAELDITERRKPQDGRLTVKTPMRIVDLRLSTMPTINGEKIVMRILDRNSTTLPLEKLGFSQENLKILKFVVSKPQGIILTTGPTGSGKTTTLYSLLQSNATAEKNYITIEDPVEYYLDRAGQVMVREKIGLDFVSVLKAVLRQDPDSILLGEIRDQKTAEIAFQAALTGHVVFSTLHTNSAVATLARIFDLGVRPYVVASALEAIIAQRLVRKLCQFCKVERDPDPTIVQQLGADFAKGFEKNYACSGCERCNHSGFSGRIGLYEILVMDERLRQAVVDSVSFIELATLAKAQGMISLLEDGSNKVNRGLTSCQEILRVLGAQVSLK